MELKKALSLALTMCMGASVLSAGAVSASAVTGGWYFSDVAAVNVTDSEKAALAEALENGYNGLNNFEATDVIASQVVSGTNSAFLCKETPAEQDDPTNWSIVTVYSGAEGSYTLKRIETIDPSDIKTTDQLPNTMGGAWYANGKETGVEISPAVQTALDGNVGMAIVPTAVLAEQVVTGKNYRILAYGTLVTAEPRTDLYVVDVYEGLDGTAEITDVAAFDILAYCSSSQQDDPTDPTDPPAPGGWVFTDVAADNVTDAQKAALASALENSYDGLSTFEATDVVATQTVLGVNAAYLCKETPVGEDAPTNWSIVTVYTDAEGNSTILKIEEIDLTAVKGTDQLPEIAPGSWAASGKETGVEVSPAVQAALDSNIGMSFVPTVILAEQVVTGKNYRILAYGTLVTAEPRTDLYVVDVYEGLDGTAEITDVAAFDILAYCTVDEDDPTKPVGPEPIEGGWHFSDVAADNVSAEAKAVLEETLKNSYNGLSTFEATDIIATQVIAGTNYAYLCKETPAGKDAPTNWSIITLFTDLSGNTTLVHIETVDPAALKTLESVPTSPIAGGWVAEGKETGAVLPEAVQTALSSNVGLSLVPTAVLAEQVIAGMNYRILAYGTLVTAEPRTDLYVVEVFAGLDGTAQITSISAFDITAYCSASTDPSDDQSSETSEETSKETSKESTPASSQPSVTPSIPAPSTGDNSFAVILTLLAVLAVGAVISVTVRSRKADRS